MTADASPPPGGEGDYPYIVNFDARRLLGVLSAGV